MERSAKKDDTLVVENLREEDGDEEMARIKLDIQQLASNYLDR